MATTTPNAVNHAGLADQAAQEITKLGGTVVAREKVGEKDTDFSGVIGKIRPLNPDAVYYGGEYPAAGPLSKQIKDAGSVACSARERARTPICAASHTLRRRRWARRSEAVRRCAAGRR